MPIKEVQSPVSRPGSKLGSNQPMSPGARSSPSRVRGDTNASPPPQPSTARVSLGNRETPASVEITGPKAED